MRWDCSKFLWESKGLGVRVSWYGVFFTVGLLLSCVFGMCLALSYQRHFKKQFREALENFALYSIPFIVIGARLAYVFFYGGKFYLYHPSEVLRIWHGGLSSHGAIAGLLLWIVLFSKSYQLKFPSLTFFYLSDLCCSAFGWAALMIRIGNFINQEIIGTPTELPWGILFSEAQDQGVVHPVQLYEGISYFLLSSLLYYLAYKRYLRLGEGWITAIVLMGVACIRFLAEFVKSHQGMVLDEGFCLTMGQILSIPLFISGIWVAIMRGTRQ